MRLYKGDIEMSIKKTLKNYLIVIMTGFLVSSATVLLVPFASFNEKGIKYTLSYVIGLAFWGGLLISILTIMVFNSYRVKNEMLIEHNKSKNHIGAFNFFSNNIAKVFDSLFIISVFIQIFSMLLNNNNQLISVIILFFVIFTFEMHCLFNGKNYLFLKESKKIQSNLTTTLYEKED